MAFVDDPNQNSENVAGATPLSQPTATPQAQGESANTQGDSSPSTIQSGSTAPKTTNKSGKAGSGMFTNIQNYVAKNQPQAAKMADNTLGEIRKANEASKTAQKNAMSQFSAQTEQGGMHDTAARKAELEAYTRQESGLQQPTVAETPSVEGQQQPAEAPVQTGIDESQFGNILNAQYQGPRNLTETGNIYSQLQKQATKSADMGKLTQTEEGRGQLLKDINTRGGRQYGAGMSKLDSMLMGQQPSQIADIMNEGSDIGTSQDIMGRMSQQSQDLAGQRATEVEATKNQARESFKNLAAERHGQVDSRIGDVVENWDKLPQHYRDIFSDQNGSIDLSAIEAATLGMDGDTRLFNMVDKFGADNLFGGVEADKTKLISTEEQGNLDRLSVLAGLSQDGNAKDLYDRGEYIDPSKAGTQSAFDALNLENFADKLEQTEKDFQKDIDQTQTGQGHKKVSRGNWRGTTTKNYYATAQDKLANQLGAQQERAIDQITQQNPDLTREQAQEIAQNSGYGYKAGEIDRLNTQPELLKALGDLSENYNVDTGEIDASKGNLNQFGGGGPEVKDVLTGRGDTWLEEGMFGEAGQDLARGVTDMLKRPEELTDGVGNFLKDEVGGDLGNLAGNVTGEIGKALGSYLSGFGGIDTGAMAKMGNAVAMDQAQNKLQSKLESEQNRLGTSNIANVTNNDATVDRTRALMELLKNLDKSNA